jgi:hypothetical protein
VPLPTPLAKLVEPTTVVLSLLAMVLPPMATLLFPIDFAGVAPTPSPPPTATL